MSDIRLYVANGKLVDPFDLQPGDIDETCIAHALSNINRYTGNYPFPYSVAQHSCVLTLFTVPVLHKAVLLHDVSEMFLADIPNPMKRILPDYQKLEFEIQTEIFRYFGVPIEHLHAIHKEDRAICMDEMNYGYGAEFKDGLGIAAIQPMKWYEAKAMYIRKWGEVFDQ
jgi:hypothetical protein